MNMIEFHLLHAVAVMLPMWSVCVSLWAVDCMGATYVHSVKRSSADRSDSQTKKYIEESSPKLTEEAHRPLMGLAGSACSWSRPMAHSNHGQLAMPAGIQAAVM